MKNFHEWLNESVYSSDVLQGAIDIANEGNSKLQDLLLKIDHSDKSECTEFKQQHNSMIKKTKTILDGLVSELNMVTSQYGMKMVDKTLTLLKEKVIGAEVNVRQSEAYNCGIPSPYTSLKNPGHAEKMRELPRQIRFIAEDLEKWIDMTSMKLKVASPAAKPAEEEGIYSKLFGKKGWLNPDAYAKPVKRPEKPRLPKI